MSSGRKIVFVDIDGTLIDHGFVCPPSAKAAIRAARQKGNILCLCTGRQRSTISRGVLRIGFDAVVSSGGARIEAGGELLFESFMPEATLRHVIDYFDAHSVPYVLERNAELTASETLLWYFRQLRARIAGTAAGQRIMNGIDSYNKQLVPNHSRGTLYPDVAKVVFVGGIPVEQVKRELDGECDVFRGSIPIFGEAGGEVSIRGIHKGFAVEFLLKHYGIAQTDAIAIGDSDNDSKMLEAAGTGIAMGNADADLKQIADYVTDRIENDGLYKAFEKYNLV